MPLTISLRNMQKVEFKADSSKCNVSFKNYTTAGGNTLLVTDVPAGAGTMLGGTAAFFAIPGFSTTPPTVFVDFSGAIVPNGGGAGIDSVKYGGRIELREF